jgi:hypothetical protein
MILLSLVFLDWLDIHPKIPDLIGMSESIQKERNVVLPYAPWCWNPYQHLPHKLPSFVGTYTSTMFRIWVLFTQLPLKMYIRN